MQIPGVDTNSMTMFKNNINKYLKVT